MTAPNIPKAGVDTSALMAIILDGGSAREAFLDGLSRCDKLVMHEASYGEASTVTSARKGKGSNHLLDNLITQLSIEIVGRKLPNEIQNHVAHIRYGFENYGQIWVPGGLNFGDTFSYAIAKEMDIPLYFQGLDFGKTDVANAMAALGYAHDAKGVPIFSSP